MKHITLRELLEITATPQLTITVTLNGALPATIDVNSTDWHQWDTLLCTFGHYDVIEVAPVDPDTLSISIAPTTGTARETKGGMTE